MARHSRIFPKFPGTIPAPVSSWLIGSSPFPLMVPPTLLVATSKNQDKLLNTIAGGGGPSGCATGATDINRSWAARVRDTPTRMAGGLLGNPSDGVRDIPDVSLFAANGSGTLLCGLLLGSQQRRQELQRGAEFVVGLRWNLDLRAIMAGIQALINQASGSRWVIRIPLIMPLPGGIWRWRSSTCNSALGNQWGQLHLQ